MLGEILKAARLSKGYKLKELSIFATIDQALISKFENGNRTPTDKQLHSLAAVLDLNYRELRKEWLTDKITKAIQYEVDANEILNLVEERVTYLKGKKAQGGVEYSSVLSGKLRLIDRLRDEWQGKKPLSKTQLIKLKEYFSTAYTYQSNRIEGNTLTLQETSLVANHGLTIGGKSMQEHLEVINHRDAIGFIEGLVAAKEPLTKRSLLETHRLILKEIDTNNAGVYRSVPVMISGSEHKPPQHFMLDKLMDDLFGFYTKQHQTLHPVVMAAEIHERLVSIHPFIDGNGRTARLIMNFILLSNGFTIANIKGDNASRLAYYKALEKTQVHNEPEDFHLLVAEEVIRSLREHLEMT